MTCALGLSANGCCNSVVPPVENLPDRAGEGLPRLASLVHADEVSCQSLLIVVLLEQGAAQHLALRPAGLRDRGHKNKKY